MATTESSTPGYNETVREVEETLGLVPEWMENLPEEAVVTEWPRFKNLVLEEQEIPLKYKELINLAVASAIKCPYCTFFHREAAKMHGATEEELAELSYLASETPSYSSMIHAQNVDVREFQMEVAKIGEHLMAQQSGSD